MDGTLDNMLDGGSDNNGVGGGLTGATTGGVGTSTATGTAVGGTTGAETGAGVVPGGTVTVSKFEHPHRTPSSVLALASAQSVSLNTPCIAKSNS